MTIATAAAMLGALGVTAPRYRTVTITQLHAHVVALAAAAGIRIVWRARSACAFRRGKRIELPGERITDVAAYAEGLHELGHLLGRGSSNQIERERMAWAWAKDNAIVWTADMATAASQFLSSYYLPRRWRGDWCYGNTVRRRRAQLDALMKPIVVVENRS